MVLLTAVLGVACGGDKEEPALQGAGGSTASGGVGGSTASGGAATTSGGKTAVTPEDFPKGFGAPEVFVPNLTQPVRLGFHDGYLYFTEMGLEDGTSSRLARRAPTGNVETIHSGTTVAALFLDQDELFFVDRGIRSVIRMKYADLKPIVFASVVSTTSDGNPLIIGDVVRRGEMIWFSQYSANGQWTALSAKSRDGSSTSEARALAKLGFIFTYFSAGGGDLYLSTQDGENSTGLYKVDSGGRVGVAVSAVSPNRVSTDATYVYLASRTDGRILRQRHTETMNEEVIASGQSRPFAVAADAGGVYWTNAPDCSGDNLPSGSVMALPLAGGSPVVVASSEVCPQAMVTDGDYVYWIRENVSNVAGDDAIVRAKKLR